MGGIPGRKSLVWISGGISMLSVTGQMGSGGRGRIKSYENLVRDTSRRLAQQGITLYMVDTRGLRGYDPTASPAGQPGRGQSGPFAQLEQAANLSADPLPAMYKMARITGGRVFWDTNDMAKGIKAVASDSKGTYSLAFYADADSDGRWRDLNVDVKRRGVKVLHRRGYLAETVAAEPLDWTEEQWRTAIYNPIGSTGLRLDAMARLGTLAQLAAIGRGAMSQGAMTQGATPSATTATAENAGRQAPGTPRPRLSGVETPAADSGARKAMLMVQIVADDLVFRRNGDQTAAQVDVAIVEKLPDGNYRKQQNPMTLTLPTKSETNPRVVSYRHMWDLLPEAATIRLIVRDRFTGRFGTLDLPVNHIPSLDGGN